jgi:hypothetical protein
MSHHISLETLPTELVVTIVLQLPVTDLLRVSQTSTFLRSIGRDWSIWAEKAQQEFKFPRDLFYQNRVNSASQRYRQIQSYQGDVNTALIQAITNNDLGGFNYLSAKAREVEAQKPWKWPCLLSRALQKASQLGHMDIVTWILDTHQSTLIDFHPLDFYCVCRVAHADCTFEIIKLIVSRDLLSPEMLDQLLLNLPNCPNRSAIADYLIAEGAEEGQHYRLICRDAVSYGHDIDEFTNAQDVEFSQLVDRQGAEFNRLKRAPMPPAERTASLERLRQDHRQARQNLERQQAQARHQRWPQKWPNVS